MAPKVLTRLRTCALLVACLPLANCVPETSGPDAMCELPQEDPRPLLLTGKSDAQHLSDDAEKAEDLSIRYGEGHSRPTNAGGPDTIREYVRVREACLASLFQVIAGRHHVTPQQVRESINAHRNKVFDAVAMLSFGVFYSFFADRLARTIWLRFSPTRDRLLGVIAAIAIAPVAGVLGVALGGWWAWYLEGIRIGYSHLVQRSDRIPWWHHVPAIFLLCMVILWLLAWLRYRDAPEPSNGVLGLTL